MSSFESSSSVYEVWTESALYRNLGGGKTVISNLYLPLLGFLNVVQERKITLVKPLAAYKSCDTGLWVENILITEPLNASVITQETSCQVLWLHNKRPECFFSKAKLAQTTLFTRLIHYTSHFYKDAVRLSGPKETGTTVPLSCSRYGNLWSCSLAARHWSETAVIEGLL